MIYGKGIRLRAIEKDDLPLFVEWLNDPEVRHGLMIYLPLSQAEEQRWFEAMLKRPQEEHPLMIEIEEQEQWIPIGNCGLFDINWRVRSAEVGIVIGEKSYWNQGHGTKAMRLLLRHGFKTLNLNRIFLRVYEHNSRAARAYEKTGFVHEGRMRQAHFHEGQYLDAIIMSVLRSEWQDVQ
ncbi:MAG: GNAT family N-acetyltransferase [Anaerolineales bacterium]|nr:GNAT family N-acetyltransferase [Anaerolineales bacterium]